MSMPTKQGQCMKCRRRMRQVCLNSPLGAACFGCCECASRDAHNTMSEAFEAVDYRKKCRDCGTDAVVCDTSKCVRHCGHATDWIAHFALAQTHAGKSRTIRFHSHKPSSTVSVTITPAVAPITPAAPAPAVAVPANPVVAGSRPMWTPPPLTYNFPYALVKQAMALGNKRVLLYGVPGTGKTSWAHRLGTEITGKEPIHVTPTEDTSEAQLTSMWSIKAMSFEMKMGAGARSWQEGRTLIVNEINRTSGTVHTAFYNILDDPGIAQMTLVDGSIITPDPNFKCVATMNGDPNELPAPLLDRFHIIEEVKMPSAEALAVLGPIYGPLCKADYESGRPDLIEARSYRRYRTMSDLEATGVVDESNRKAALALVFPKNQVQAIDDAIRLGMTARK